jgi:hypothetical protein
VPTWNAVGRVEHDRRILFKLCRAFNCCQFGSEFNLRVCLFKLRVSRN